MLLNVEHLLFIRVLSYLALCARGYVAICNTYPGLSLSSLARSARCYLRIPGRSAQHHAFISRATREFVTLAMSAEPLRKTSFHLSRFARVVTCVDYTKDIMLHFHFSRYARDVIRLESCGPKFVDFHLSRYSRDVAYGFWGAVPSIMLLFLTLRARCYKILAMVFARDLLPYLALRASCYVLRSGHHGGTYILSYLALRARCYIIATTVVKEIGTFISRATSEMLSSARPEKVMVMLLSYLALRAR